MAPEAIILVRYKESGTWHSAWFATETAAQKFMGTQSVAEFHGRQERP